MSEPDDYDMDAEMARFLADIEEGREQIPDPGEATPAAIVAPGEACGIDPAASAAMYGPDGLGAFAQGGAADALRPGPVLSALAEQAVEEAAVLTDNQLLGALSAIQRLRGRADYLETVAVAEFTRRRAAEAGAARARKDRGGLRIAEHADAELAFHQVTTIAAAGDRMDMAAALTTRLPHTLAGMAAGAIDHDRAYLIWFYTRFLSDEDAARADEILAAAAPELRVDQLGRKAYALEMKLDPEAARARKEHAREQGQRVETRREASGNMSLAGRELAAEDALAAKARNDADAAALRDGGVAGTLARLRAMAYIDRLLGRDPLGRVTAEGGESEECGGDGGDGGQGPRSGISTRPAPMPMLINLIVPAGTMLGWSNAPGDAGSWGLFDGDDTRSLVQAASLHPRTRWCVTLTGADGTAVAHGCATGQHPWTPDPDTAGGCARDGPRNAARLADLLRRLNVTLVPIARGGCDHRNAEDRYLPSRRLRHLVCARTVKCPARGCGAQAHHGDQDHTIPYPAGITDECNLSPPCRRHHRAKQAPGWHLEQPEPGVMRWRLPSGRVYTTTPTVYDS
jgi:uncharacterized protein DUF222